MSIFFHQLVTDGAKRWPDNTALSHKDQQRTYAQLANDVRSIAHFIKSISQLSYSRVGVYLPKSLETATSLFAISAAGKVFVPINAVLKPLQVSHILSDCDVEILITSRSRLKQLARVCNSANALKHIIVIDQGNDVSVNATIHQWPEYTAQNAHQVELSHTSSDMAAILYTSGSTGAAKGVVLSHQNLLYGANSVAQYLENTEQDNILALLPLSFDYGLSQITSALCVGAHCILMDYLLPNDVVTAVQRFKVTGLAGVPPLWSVLMKCNWDRGDVSSLRYFTNSGGAMPKALLSTLRQTFPHASPYLMYGLTEAFRSTYLDPSYIDSHPDSIGKAIPNAMISVINEDGIEAKDNELGELVHAGPLVSLGYWNAEEKTQARFKHINLQAGHHHLPRYAVFSGDWVTRDKDGFLYFVGRKDDMIKSSGYRISPSEVEEVIYQQPKIIEAAALGLPHPELGQGIVIVYRSENNQSLEHQLATLCRSELANFMQPHHYLQLDNMPHNANGKIDRSLLSKQLKNTFNTD